jgi:hypothetical protein
VKEKIKADATFEFVEEIPNRSLKGVELWILVLPPDSG